MSIGIQTFFDDFTVFERYMCEIITLIVEFNIFHIKLFFVNICYYISNDIEGREHPKALKKEGPTYQNTSFGGRSGNLTNSRIFSFNCHGFCEISRFIYIASAENGSFVGEHLQGGK